MLLRSEGDEADLVRALLTVWVLNMASARRDHVMSVLQRLGVDASNMQTMDQRNLNCQRFFKAFRFRNQSPEAKVHL